MGHLLGYDKGCPLNVQKDLNIKISSRESNSGGKMTFVTPYKPSSLNSSYDKKNNTLYLWI